MPAQVVSKRDFLKLILRPKNEPARSQFQPMTIEQIAEKTGLKENTAQVKVSNFRTWFDEHKDKPEAKGYTSDDIVVQPKPNARGQSMEDVLDDLFGEIEAPAENAGAKANGNRNRELASSAK